MKLNFVVGDDQIEVLYSTANFLKQIIKENNIDGEIALVTNNPADILNYSGENYVRTNVYILDINFNNEINGVSIAKSIREKDPYSYIIFITAHIEFSMLTFKYRLKVFDFLIKPVEYCEIEECIKALYHDFIKMNRSNKFMNKNLIKIKSGYQDMELAVDEIIYIESFGSKLIFHMQEGVIETYSTLKDVEAAINKGKQLFQRTHRSFLINLSKIKDVDLGNNEVLMSNGDKCPIARSQKQFFKEYTK